MADESPRVEPRTALVGRGLGASPERIEELREEAERIDKLHRPAPARPFDEVLASVRDEDTTPATEQDADGVEELPPKGPRPALLHPAQRERYGREGRDEEVVVLKG